MGRPSETKTDTATEAAFDALHTGQHCAANSPRRTTYTMSATETATTPLIPPDFLQDKAPNITVDRVDFEAVGLPMYKGLYAVVLDDVLSPTECETLIAAAEASNHGKGWERAMVNVGGGKQRLITDARNCGRIIWDSRDVVARIWHRIEHLPEVQEITRLENVPRIFGNGPAKWGEVWKFTRPNERMRFLKYTGGEYFRPHCDGTYETPDRKERTYFTLHLYLNTSDVVSKEEAERKGIAGSTDSVLVGGATTFHAYVSDPSLTSNRDARLTKVIRT